MLSLLDERQRLLYLLDDQIFSIKDTITDTISNMCEPQIIPDIYIAEIEDKHIIVVEIYPGPNFPYFITSLGLQNGTYVRISGLSKLADETTIKELQFRGSNLRFDERVNLQYPTTSI